MVAVSELLSMMEAPTTGSPLASVTLPDAVMFWAWLKSQNAMRAKTVIVSAWSTLILDFISCGLLVIEFWVH